MKSRIFLFIFFPRSNDISKIFQNHNQRHVMSIFNSQTRQDSNQHMFQNASLFRPDDFNSLFSRTSWFLTFYHPLNFIHFFLYNMKGTKPDTIFHLKHLQTTSGCVKMSCLFTNPNMLVLWQLDIINLSFLCDLHGLLNCD